MTQDASIPTGKRAEKPARKAKPARKVRTRQVRKCVEAVHITNNINLVQRKLINGLLLNAYYELPNQSITIHRIPVSQLVDLIGYDSNDIAHIKVLLKALTNTVIEWDIMNEAGKREWGVSALLASADIIDGVCTYAYSPHLRAKLFNPQFYVLLDMDIVRRFQSGYALALYEKYRYPASLDGKDRKHDDDCRHNCDRDKIRFHTSGVSALTQRKSDTHKLEKS